jgi:large subunit ribosomal protein L10
MDRDQKTAVVKELTEELKDSQAIFAIDYRGMSVPQAAELRAGLRDAETRFQVVKNRLTLRAADAAGTEPLKEHLEGPTALAFVKGDAALAAKTIFRLGSEWELLDYKGGLMDGETLDSDSFVAIARLPGRDQLNAQFAGIVASPVTGLVRGLGSLIQGLALQLGQIAEKGLVSGEAPPAEEETPAEEEPSAEEPAPDPEPSESSEEESEEKAPDGEDAGQGEPAETSEGDADIGEEPGGQDETSDETSEETSEDSDENKEEGT